MLRFGDLGQGLGQLPATLSSLGLLGGLVLWEGREDLCCFLQTESGREDRGAPGLKASSALKELVTSGLAHRLRSACS